MYRLENNVTRVEICAEIFDYSKPLNNQIPRERGRGGTLHAGRVNANRAASNIQVGSGPVSRMGVVSWTQ